MGVNFFSYVIPFESVSFFPSNFLSYVISVESFSFFPSFLIFLLSWDRPGGGRGSCREPLADCSSSQRTVNRKGLYIISS